MACKVFFKCTATRMLGDLKFKSVDFENCLIEPREGMEWYVKVGAVDFPFKVKKVIWFESEERFEVILKSSIVVDGIISMEELLERINADPRWEIVRY